MAEYGIQIMNKGLRIKDCIIILLATIVITTIVKLFIRALPLNETIEEALSYTVGMGLSFLVAVRKYQKHSGTFDVDINSSCLKFIPLIIIWPILMVFGITSHFVYLIPTPEYLTEMYNESENSIGWLSILTVALVGPVLEELIFRGVVLKGLLHRYTPLQAIFISSVFFGLVHLNPWQFFGALGIGIISGWIYWKTNNLILPIAMHISNNLIFALFGIYFGTSYLIDTPMQEVFGSQANQLIAVGVSVFLFGAIWYFLSKRIKLRDLESTPYNNV